jgi:glycosyltransferase involved in cell wall biosynthesis
VLTATTLAPNVEQRLLERVDRFVVEYPAGKTELANLGISTDRVRLVFPPVDLEKFAPAPPPDGPFTVLFASSPDEPGWLAARGVPQLLDAATLRPAMRFRFLWRPWGSSLGVVRQWVADRGLQNVEIVAGVCANMPAEYRRAHVTAAPFIDMTRSKLAPNSLVESLACGRPVLASEAVGLAEVIAEHRAGRIVKVTGAALAEQLDCLQAEWSQHAERARALAERHFGTTTFLEGYSRVYSELLWS